MNFAQDVYTDIHVTIISRLVVIWLVLKVDGRTQTMSKDKQRLREIQHCIMAYSHELEESETITDCLRIQNHIDELEKEEKEILTRGGVKIG